MEAIFIIFCIIITFVAHYYTKRNPYLGIAICGGLTVLLMAIAVSSQAAEITVHKQEQKVYFTGNVVMGDAEKLYNALVEIGPDKDVLLLVESEGGNAHEGILMHQLLERHGRISVKVLEGCASSCANMALGAKYISGVLHFHNARYPVHMEKLASKKQIEDLAAGNEFIHEEVWRDRLTEKEIAYILKHESRDYLVGVRFRDF